MQPLHAQVEHVQHAHHEPYKAMDMALGVARIALGAIFLWAFVDKLFGLGFSTPAARSWLNGGSPTKGYLGSSVGPLADAFKAIAGNPITDSLFMLGLAAVGAALILGVGIRIAAISGTAMLLLMYVSHPPWAAANATNPVVDDHLVYAALMAAFAFGSVGRFLGLGGAWRHVKLVQRFRWLE